MKSKAHLKVFADQGSSVYDNMFSKPPQLGADANATRSVAVLFSVKGPTDADVKGNPELAKVRQGTWHGQYNFGTCSWSVLPGDSEQPECGIPDRLVSAWGHLPTYRVVCADYSADSGSHQHVPPLRSKPFDFGEFY